MTHIHFSFSIQQMLRTTALAFCLMIANGLSAQSNVFDDIIASSPNHTALKAALEQEGLEAALRDNNATLTVFAPTDDAFSALATALNTDLNGLLALPNLRDILLYHVLGSTVASADISNGQLANPLNTANSLKLTLTGNNEVYVNQAMVTTADLQADNGLVHVLNAVVLPSKTVADIAIDNGFSTLVAAVVQAELLPALTNPFAQLTVFAPSNEAFDSLAARLNTDLNGLLALPNLSDVLLYHVLGEKSMAADLSNGALLNPLNTANSLKVTITSNNGVFLNQATIGSTDLEAGNGVVHVLNDVVLPGKTVADIAIDNGFTTLVAAVVQEELLPALTDPFADYTVFAPTNDAFTQLATDLNLSLEEVLALPNLKDILLYHVVGESLESGELSNGTVNTLATGQTLDINTDNGVLVNGIAVDQADLTSENGVVHVIGGVLQPGLNSIENSLNVRDLEIFPNPANNFLKLAWTGEGSYVLQNMQGQIMQRGAANEIISVQDLPQGLYLISIQTENSLYQGKFIRQ